MKEIKWMTVAKAIGILLVVFGHSYPFEVDIPVFLDEVRNFIYCFHMPLFVFLSGYLITKLDSIGRKGPVGFIKKRAIRLLTPYFVLSILFFFPKIIASNYINDSVSFSFGYFLKTMLSPRDNVWGHFWYLPMLFGMTFFAVAYDFLLKKNRLIGAIAAILSAGLIFLPATTDWLSVDDILHFLPWLLFGMCMGSFAWEEKAKKLWPLSPVLLLAAIGLFLLEIKYLKPIIALCIIGAVVLISLKMRETKIIEYLGKNSFTIFILSWPFQACTEILFNRVLHLPVLAVMPMMLLGGIIGPVLIIAIVRKLNKKFKLKYLKLTLGMN